MTEVESAGLHNQIVETLGGKYKISTPGISRGNFKWMDVSILCQPLLLPSLPRLFQSLTIVGLARSLRDLGWMPL